MQVVGVDGSDLGAVGTLITDVSGIGWARVLTQEFEDDQGKKKHHPICYMSGQIKIGLT